MIKSKYIVNIPHTNIYFNSLMGNFLRLNKDAIKFLDNPSQYEKILSKKDKKIVEELKKCFFLVNYDGEERDIFKDGQKRFFDFLRKQILKFNSLNLIITTECNFNCPYCMRKRLSNHPSIFMDWTTAKSGIDNMIKHRASDDIYIDFDGGETLLNFNLIKRVVEYCNNQKLLTFHFGLLTNGYLVTKEVLDFLKLNNFILQISLDGFQHNVTRSDFNNKPSFDYIFKIIREIQKRKIRFRNVATTLTEDTWDGINEEFLQLIKKMKVRLSLNPDLFSFMPFGYNRTFLKLKKLLKYAIENRIDFSGSWVTDYKMPEANKERGEFILYPRCKGLGWAGLSLHPDGFYSNCSYNYNYRFKDFPSLLHHLSTDDCFDRLANRLPGSIEYCRNCEIEGICTLCQMIIDNQFAYNKVEELRELCRLIKDISFFCIKNMY